MCNLSLFKNYFDTSGQETTLEEVTQLIRHDERVKELTKTYRHLLASSADKKACDAIKHESPCFAVAVRFDGGKGKDQIAGWTGLTLADFDHLPADRMEALKALVAQDPHTLLAYTTISGEGLRIVSRINLPHEQPDRHYPTLFKTMNRHYEELLGEKADGLCKNDTRLSGLAHDPDLIYHPDAVTFDPDTDCMPYSKRLKRIIDAAKKELERDGVAYLPGQHNRYIMRMGYLMNLYGADCEEATRWAMQQFADYDGDVAGIFRSCYKHEREHGTRHLPRKSRDEGANRTMATVGQIKDYLSEIAEYRWNSISLKTEYCLRHAGDEWHEVDDRFVNSAWCELCQRHGYVRERQLPQILDSDFVPMYNPFHEYFSALPTWDGRDYIGELTAGVHCLPNEEADDDFTFDEAFRHWIVAMVAALFDADKVNEEILVLVGKQGTYKTTWLARLLPPELRSYFRTKANSDHFDKDDRISLSEFAVVCLEELDVIQSRELSQLKSLTGLRRIHERAAYSRYKRERLHIASFCGTSNVVQFLSDRSKNRRWLVFEVESIDSPYDNPIPYPQFYAQVLHLLHSGYSYLFGREDIERINRHNTPYEVPDLEAELILHHFRKPLEYEKADFLTASEIYQRINYGIRTPLALNRITGLMKRLGFKYARSLNRRGFLVKNAN